MAVDDESVQSGKEEAVAKRTLLKNVTRSHELDK